MFAFSSLLTSLGRLLLVSCFAQLSSALLTVQKNAISSCIQQNRMSIFTSKESSDFAPSPPMNPVGTTSSDADYINNRLQELGEPLLDFELIRKTIEQWSRPLPASYLSMPLVLVGPSGVGKGRLVKALLKDYTRFFVKIVTHTTRLPRPDEINGTSYNFVCNETFHEMVANKHFLEWAKVHDNFYGTTVEAWKRGQRAGKISIMEIDVQGARSIKSIAGSYGMRPNYIFIAPPAIEKLQNRLLQRGTETPEQIKLRVENAVKEMKEAEELGFDHILVNDDFGDTVNAFFRTMTDWYPALPSAARFRMLQRRIKQIKILAVNSSNSSSNSSAGTLVIPAAATTTNSLNEGTE